MASGAEPQAPIRNIFPFSHKPNTLDRDRIVVPAGWDSWGKIAIMRDGFDAKTWGEAWERDLDENQNEGGGARKLFAALVPDQGTKPTPFPPFNNPTPEQAFLAKNYDENAKKPDRDPRGAFRNPADLTSAAAGIVGPLGSSSFSLPTVERALTDMEVGIGGGAGAANADPSRRIARNAAGLAPVGTPAALGKGSGSPTQGSPTNGQSQHEVLHNFFQSLLSSGGRAGANAATTGRAPVAPKPGGSGPEEGST